MTELSDAEFFIGDLFRRRFRHDPPELPLHYVAFYRSTASTYVPVGYVHYFAFDDDFLCGGLVIDNRLYRLIPVEHRRLIHGAGGIAELLLRDTFARLAHAPAIWATSGTSNRRSFVCVPGSVGPSTGM